MAEAALYNSDLEFTILQPTIFVRQFDSLCRSARRGATIAMPYSADSLMACADYRDVAEVAVQAFVTDRFSGGTFELSSPGTYRRHGLARLMGDVLGARVTAQRVQFEAWADSMSLPNGPVREPRTVRGCTEELARL